MTNRQSNTPVINAKWTTLKHGGPKLITYEPLPSNVPFIYAKTKIRLSKESEEIACLYAASRSRLQNQKQKKIFDEHFFSDWKDEMTDCEKMVIKDFKLCDFSHIEGHIQRSRNNSEHSSCKVDGISEQIINDRIGLRSLYFGKGENLNNYGKIRKPVLPEDVTINCTGMPRAPNGHNWASVVSNKNVLWLASWKDSVTKRLIYMKLDRSSKPLTKIDEEKFNKAREIYKHIDTIRHAIRLDIDSKDLKIQQLGVAMYLIDKLALRAGNEKTTTVACCSLRLKHIKVNSRELKVELTFEGKSYVEYHQTVEVEKNVFNKLHRFMKNKDQDEKLFDLLNTKTVNRRLGKLVDGLSCKVFRTFHASSLMERMLNTFTDSYSNKLEAFKQANIEVAKLLNHKSKEVISTVSSKRNYIDPRIIVAWCINNHVPIEQVFNNTEQKIFKWAIDQHDKKYRFIMKK